MTECIDCRALPELPGDPLDAAEDVEYRPVRPRPAPHGGPRSRRCTTHHRAWKAAQKARQAETRVMRTYGLTDGEYDALYAFQGGRCAVCQRATGAARRLAVDHDHQLARLHDHPEDRGCPDCIRALTCAPCNRIILGRYDVEALLRAIDVLSNPTYQQMRRAS